MTLKNETFSKFSSFLDFSKTRKIQLIKEFPNESLHPVGYYRDGNKIHIKNRGKFTDYCNGKVTLACIKKGKNSPDAKIRKRATFADNVRKWKHQFGGNIFPLNTSF